MVSWYSRVMTHGGQHLINEITIRGMQSHAALVLPHMHTENHSSLVSLPVQHCHECTTVCRPTFNVGLEWCHAPPSIP